MGAEHTEVEIKSGSAKEKHIRPIHTINMVNTGEGNRPVSITLYMEAEQQQITGLIEYLRRHGISDLPKGGSSSGIYMVPSDTSLTPTGVVSIERFVDQDEISANLAHAAQILNTAVNLSCKEVKEDVELGKADHMIAESAWAIATHCTEDYQKLGVVRELLNNIFTIAYETTTLILRTDDQPVLASFDEHTAKHVRSMMHPHQSLWGYISQVGLGTEGFTYFSSPKGVINDNQGLMTLITAIVLKKAHKCYSKNAPEGASKTAIEGTLDTFLQTKPEVIHKLLLKAARGVEASIGGDGNGLEPRLIVEIEGVGPDSLLKLGLDGAAQSELTERITTYNEMLDKIIELVSGPVKSFCDANNITVGVVPSNSARRQNICPVLKHPGEVVGQNAESIPLHRGYDHPQVAYMEQVELVYAVLRRLRGMMTA